jgi:integrase
MTVRRGRGEGSVFYDADRRCYVGVLDMGADPDTGKRRRRKVSAPTKTAARDKLRELAAEPASTGTVAPRDITVETVVRDWLANLPPEIKSPVSVQLVNTHGERIIAAMGAVKMTELKASRVETFLRKMAGDGYPSSVIQQTRLVLVRAIDQAQRDDKVGKNVARLVKCPAGRTRRSRSMTEAQALQLLGSDLDTWWRAYFTLALHCGLRPGELTGLRWEDVDFTAGVIRVRQSLKRGEGGLTPGDLKTDSSKRTLALPEAVRAALTALRRQQAADKLRLGQHYHGEHDLVFRDSAGRPMARQRVHKRFKEVMAAAGLGTDWQPRETWHSFVSIASANGASIEDIADAAGHVNPNVTRAVYRHQISDTVTRASAAMDRALAPKAGEQA